MPDRLIARHDISRLARARFLDEYGAPINLSGYTVTYTMQHLRLRTLKVNRASATLVDQTVSPGEVYYPWIAADVDTSGTYREQWETVDSSGRLETFPIGETQLVRVLEDIDNA